MLIVLLHHGNTIIHLQMYHVAVINSGLRKALGFFTYAQVVQFN